MGSFRFLHAADVHLDSPLHGLARYEGIPHDDVRSATRAAFDNLIEMALREQVDFLVIAGDLYDGEWKHMGTGLYFAHAMGRLDREGIPVFLLAGNHDAASVITRQIPWPANVRLFSSRQPQTHLLEDLGVAVHGQSFATPAVTENLVAKYPDAIPHAFNTGVLHTALSGPPGHAPYAPATFLTCGQRATTIGPWDTSTPSRSSPLNRTSSTRATFRDETSARLVQRERCSWRLPTGR